MNNPSQVFPEKFLNKLPEIVPQKMLDDVLASFCTRKPSTFRANTLKIAADDLEEKLKSLGIETERVPWYNDAFILKNVPQKILAETDFYKNGFLYIQSLSSMIPPLVLEPKPGEKILDICAAPGSKTTQIAALIENKGEILANDKSHVRNYKLRANLALQGATIAKVTQFPGEMIWKKFPEYFDRALVDVPCSMEGRFFTEDEKTYRDWSPTKVRELAGTQKFLLRSAISATKPGGVIIYSTCTLSTEENEEIIDWILKKERDTITIESPFPIGNDSSKDLFSTGIGTYKQKVFDTQVQKTLRIFPSTLMEGFFVAKIKKLKSNLYPA